MPQLAVARPLGEPHLRDQFRSHPSGSGLADQPAVERRPVLLETGEDDPVLATIPRAGELYLEALMWANSAAESLFGAGGPDLRPQ